MVEKGRTIDLTGFRVIRVFVSSTFRDMQAERDHLVRFVFPRLREELLKRRIHLVDVDLRWGVTSDQDVIEVCREIIDECRPRFICMLGGRYGWTPPGEEQSITAAEIQYAALNQIENKKYRYFYFRDPQVTISIPEPSARAGGYREFVLPEEIEKFGEEVAETLVKQREKKLLLMKQAIVDAGFEPYIYQAYWKDKEQRLIGLEDFGDRVYVDLLTSINDEFGVAQDEAIDEFTEEKAAMNAFGEERVEHFVVGSRQALLDKMNAFAEMDGKPNVLAITGKSGLGKSALLAWFYQEYKKKYPDEVIVLHFMGASVGSTDLRKMLRRLCYELTNNFVDSEEIPWGIKELIQLFSKLIKQEANSKRVILIIGALNQIDATNNAHSMYWLPENLPPGVRVLVSSLDHPALEVLRHRYNSVRELELQPLTQDDGQAVIEKFLNHYHKRLSQQQLKTLLEKTGSTTPLYLLTALEELRTLGTYEEITNRIQLLPDEIRELFIWILDKRLSRDPGFRDQDGNLIGRELVHKFVSFLGASKSGLSQKELVELISPGDPLGNVASLQRFLKPYLMYRGETLNFFHSQLREAVDSEYLNKKEDLITAHRTLAEYFCNKADPSGDSKWNGNNPHALIEIPFQLIHGNMLPELENILCNLFFVEAKCSDGMIYDLMKDYSLAMQQSNLRSDALIKLDAFRRFLQSHSQVLREYPMLTFQDAANEYQNRIPAKTALSIISKGEFNQPWMHRLEKPQTQSGCRLSLKGHTSSVYSCSTSLDSARVASAGWDGMRIWDMQSGEQYFDEPVIKVPLGYVCFTPQGIWIHLKEIGDISCLELVEENSWRILKIQDLSGFSVDKVTISSNGKFAALCKLLQPVLIYDLQTWKCIAKLELKFVGPCAFSANGKELVILDSVGNIHFWEISSEHEKYTQDIKIHEAQACTLSPDGSMLAVVCSDRIVCFEVLTWLPIFNIKGHAREIEDCVFSSDGLSLISCSKDGAINSWDVRYLKEQYAQNKIDIPDDLQRSSTYYIPGWRKIEETIDPWKHTLDKDSTDAWRISSDGLNVGIAHSVGRLGLIKISKIHNEFNSGKLGSYSCIPTRFDLSYDSTNALRGYEDGNLSITKIDNEEELRFFRAHFAAITDCRFSPNGAHIVSASKDRLVKVWNTNTTGLEVVMSGHSGFVNCCTFSPNGKTIASASSDKTIKVWDAETGILSFTLEGNYQAELTCCFSPDGTRIASGTTNGKIVLWDLISQKEIKILQGHSDWVEFCFWSEDGRYILSASRDGSIRMWDVQTYQCRAIYVGQYAIKTCTFSPNGRFVLAGTANKEVLCLEVKNIKN